MASVLGRLRSLTNETDPSGDYGDEELEKRLEECSGDLFRVAAEIWEEKAAKVTDRYDFSADGATLNRSQIVSQMLRTASLLRSRSRVRIIPLGGVQDHAK